MKGKKHSAEQVIKKLREADAMIARGKTIGQVVQTLEISEQTLNPYSHNTWYKNSGQFTPVRRHELNRERKRKRYHRRSGEPESR